MGQSLQILFEDTTRALVHDAREGRPTSVTSVRVYEDIAADTSTAESATSGSASIESVSTTVDVASGASQADPTKIFLTSTANIAVNRQYLITNAVGQSEWVEIEAIAAGDYVLVRNTLLNDYPVASTFVSTRMSISLASAWVSDIGNVSSPLSPRPRWRAVFEYVVGGVTYRAVVLFDVTRYPFTHGVTALDVDRRSRGWLSRLAPEDRESQGAEKIELAVEQVKLDLHEHEDLAAAALRHPAIVDELIVLKAVELVHADAVAHSGANPALLEASSKSYWHRLEGLIAKASKQVTADGAAGQTSRAQVWRL